jgi:hypothetical protein
MKFILNDLTKAPERSVAWFHLKEIKNSLQSFIENSFKFTGIQLTQIRVLSTHGVDFV